MALARSHSFSSARRRLSQSSIATRRCAHRDSTALEMLGGEAGFSLAEVMVATALLATAVVTLAQLFGIATRSNLSSRNTTYATVLAEQKMEELRGLTWGFDAQGLPITDNTTDTSVSP